MHNICFMDHSLVAVFTLLLFVTLSSTDQGMELIKPHVKLAEAITCLILEPYTVGPEVSSIPFAMWAL